MPTSASNVRKDLNEFQEKHATLVLTTVKVNSMFFKFYFCKILESACFISFLCCIGFALCVSICNVIIDAFHITCLP